MPNCSNCGAPTTAGDGEGLVCGHCGSMDERVAVFYDLETLGDSSVACPRCKTTLADARIEGCPVRYCSACHGVLVQMQHFVTLSDAVRLASPGPASRFRGGNGPVTASCSVRSAGNRC